jgi:hypothetical protein
MESAEMFYRSLHSIASKTDAKKEEGSEQEKVG